MSPQSVVREIDCARRMLFAAREDRSLPRGYDASLCALHERKPFPHSESEIAEIAAEIRDPSYRVNVSAVEGVPRSGYRERGMDAGRRLL